MQYRNLEDGFFMLNMAYLERSGAWNFKDCESVAPRVKIYYVQTSSYLNGDLQHNSSRFSNFLEFLNLCLSN
jgi:hypothetical protein